MRVISLLSAINVRVAGATLSKSSIAMSNCGGGALVKSERVGQKS